MHVLLHESVERNDVCVKRGNKSDIGELDPADGGWKLQSDLDDAVSLDRDLRCACDQAVVFISLLQGLESLRVVSDMNGRGGIEDEAVV
jgi:hypothetical protein